MEFHRVRIETVKLFIRNILSENTFHSRNFFKLLQNHTQKAAVHFHQISGHQNMESTFMSFCTNEDGLLNIEEFTKLTNALFRNEKGRAYKLKDTWVKEFFSIFDKNNDGFIDREEFELCWEKWIKIIISPIVAFLIVDVQNDFISGSLNISNFPAQQNGSEIIEPINNLLETIHFDIIVYTLDWHPNNHISFIDNVRHRKIHSSSPVKADAAQVGDTVIFGDDDDEESVPIVQTLWPRHCVQDSWGSELHPDLKIVESGIKIYKGTNPEVDSYSAFWNNNKMAATKLDSELKSRRVTDVYVCGLAYDVCVKATVLDALELGYRTVLIEDCCRGINLEAMEETKDMIIAKNGLVINAKDVESMVEGRIRRPEMGYKLAMDLKEREPEDE